MSTKCRAKNPTMCRVHGTGDEYTQLQEQANHEAAAGDISAYMLLREKMDNVSGQYKKQTVLEPSLVSATPTEASSINLLYKEPVFNEVQGTIMSVECVCGRVRYGADYKCHCGADPKDISGYRVAEKDRKLVESRVAVKTLHWYHSTNHDNWDDVVKNSEVPIHLGSEQASFERAVAKFSATGNGEYYLYKVTINPFARIAKNICPDLNNHWSATMDEFKKNTRGRDFVRYVNSYEDGGSVSLYGNPQMFNVVEVTKEIGY
jgi:hypothetical protein